MDPAVVFYEAGMSLRVIADELGLNSIKVRKLLITAGVYASDVADKSVLEPSGSGCTEQ